MKPSREHLVRLRGQIAALEAETYEKIKRYGDGSEYELWGEFNMAVEPLRRAQEAIVKVITDYIALQPVPPMIIRKLGH